jgi:antitoxin (DNA-binding transcriptional repressor) of toxin-antitoxin stability system
MVAIHVSELREQAETVLRRLQETREPIEILDNGRTIAKLVPVDDDTGSAAADSAAAIDARTAAIWDDLERLSVEIGRRWPADVSAAQAVRDDRRNL